MLFLLKEDGSRVQLNSKMVYRPTTVIKTYAPTPKQSGKYNVAPVTSKYKMTTDTGVKADIRHSPEFAKWKDAVIGMSKGWMCAECGKKHGLQIHHKVEMTKILKENKVETFEQALKVPLLWEPSNGILLCGVCHVKKHTI